MAFDFVTGEVLLVDKPLTWTSFDVVKKIRGAIKLKKIGHAGTLDPLATGLIILCTGKMTKQIDTYQAQEKEYTGTFVIGQTTPSYDLESEVSEAQDISQVSSVQIEQVRQQLVGDLMQIPPIFSAVKIDGKRAYSHARKGEDIILQPRAIQIHEFEITHINLPEVGFRIVCSKGTYIRSMARDFGELLGTGAYLSSLRRTRIGNFHVNDAHQLDQLIEVIKNQHADL